MGELGDLSPGGSIAVGVIVGVISTSVQSLGLTLQRKSHILEDEKDPYDDSRRPPYRRRRWQIGMFMFIISNVVGSTIQITTLPLPVLSTLQASGLVFNTLFATLILGEPFTRYSFFGTLLVCSGAILIATFGAISDPAHNLEQLILLLKRKPFIIWMVLTVFLVVLTFVGVRVVKILNSPSRTKPSHKHSRIASTTRAARVRLVRGLMFGFMSGVLSAHSLLMAKSAVELVVRTIVDGANQFNRWQSWVILLALIFFALSQLYYLHRGLKLCSTSVLYPFVFCIYNIIAILDGLIYFHQTSQLTPLDAGLIALGTAILLSGVLALSWRLDDTQAPTTPGAPLTPGMGTTDEIDHASPSTPFKPYTDEEAQHILSERQPLLHDRRGSMSRRRTTPILPPPDPTTELAQIWAELDDSPEDDFEDNGDNTDGAGGHTDEDTLASLPHSPPIFPRFFQNRHGRSPNLPHRRSSSASTSSSRFPYHSSNRQWDTHSAGNLGNTSHTNDTVSARRKSSDSTASSSVSISGASHNRSFQRTDSSSNSNLRLEMKKNRRRKSAPAPVPVSMGFSFGIGRSGGGDGSRRYGTGNANGNRNLEIRDGQEDTDERGGREGGNRPLQRWVYAVVPQARFLPSWMGGAGNRRSSNGSRGGHVGGDDAERGPTTAHDDGGSGSG